MKARAAVAVVGSGMFAAAACSSVSQDQRIGIIAPDEVTFAPVMDPTLAGQTPGDYFVHRCGSLDCHGQMGRNFRVWGCEGMRFADADIPGCAALTGGTPTTAEEYHETYRSLVGLEPAVMSYVVINHGAHPELLTFIRKARGTEAHKGGQLIQPGDDQDLCVTAWLAGTPNHTACQRALQVPLFPLPDASTE